jgi:hypothetical protein
MSETVVIASGLYCPLDGGELQAFALLEQGENPRRPVPALKLLCRECGWLGHPAEAIER